MRSSTETELVGVDDLMPAVLWSSNFLKAQGYRVNQNIVYQDNKSAMLLERNGKASSGQRTKHINIRYFFITDRIKKGNVDVRWCSTTKMTVDFFTKPLQGSLFKRFRDLIMGVTLHPDVEGSAAATEEPAQDEAGDQVMTSEEPGRSTRRHRSVLGNEGSD